MSKGKFGVPWEIEVVNFPKEKRTDVLLSDKDHFPICASPNESFLPQLERAKKCTSACDGIKDPEKTIPKLVESSEFAIDAMELMLDDMDDFEPGDKNTVYFAIQELKKALEGVSDE